jgi:flagellar biosynthesis GTPase FlhF
MVESARKWAPSFFLWGGVDTRSGMSKTSNFFATRANFLPTNAPARRPGGGAGAQKKKVYACNRLNQETQTFLCTPFLRADDSTILCRLQARAAAAVAAEKKQKQAVKDLKVEEEKKEEERAAAQLAKEEKAKEERKAAAAHAAEVAEKRAAKQVCICMYIHTLTHPLSMYTHPLSMYISLLMYMYTHPLSMYVYTPSPKVYAHPLSIYVYLYI